VRFLVIQKAFIGDVVLGLVVPQALKALHPEAKIDYLVRKGTEGFLHGHPDLNQVLVWDKQQGKLSQLRHWVTFIRQQRYDAVLNLHRFGSSGVITALSGSPLRVGFRKNPFSRWFTHRVEHRIGAATDPAPPHEVDRNLLLVKALHPAQDFAPPQWRQPRLFPHPTDVAAVAAYTQQPFVVVAPASVWFTKQWPAERWREVVQRLAQQQPVYVTGAPNEQQLCEGIVQGIEGATSLAGKLTLAQSVALMAAAQRVFCNDSSPIHFASALGVPTTAVFCSTIPAFGFGPLAPGSRVVEVEPTLPCRPCGLHGHRACPKGHFRCATEIRLEQVVASSQANRT
jgi:heptosyltransferase-2